MHVTQGCARWSIPTPGVFWWAYQTYRIVGYRFQGRTELTEVSGAAMEVVPNSPKSYRVRTEPYSRVRWGFEAVPNHFGRVNTPGVYPYRIVGYQY